MFDWLRQLFFSSRYKSSNTARAVVDAEDIAVNKVAAVVEDAPAQALASPTVSAQVDNVSAQNALPQSVTAKSCGASWQQRDDVSANYHHWLFENESSDLDTNPVETEILDALEKIVKSNQSGANLVRRMPGLVPQLLQSLRSENFSGAELSRKISHDVVLVAAVIRLANSSFYNTSQTISSIEHAVMVLGQNGLRQLITSVAFRPIIDMNSGHFTKMVAPRIWDQSARCAVANRVLAVEDKVDPFEAFLAGLVQNVGLIVSLRIIDQYAEGKGPVGSETFCTYLLRYARFLSCSIGREWNFPESVTTAIEEQGTVFDSAKMSPIGKVLSLGDYLSKVKILVENDRLTEGDPRLLKNLSAEAINCYTQLESFEAFEPVVESKSESAP